MYDDIVSVVQKNKENLLNKLPFIRENKNLNNFQKLKFTFSAPSVTDLIDSTELTFGLLKNEINQAIYNKILKSVFSTNNYDYLDLTSEFNATKGGILIDTIRDSLYEYNYLITNGSLASDIQDTSAFSVTFKKGSLDQNMGAIPYHFGSLMGKECFTDPFMRYDDTRICLFNKIDLNINNVYLSNIRNDDTFAPVMIFEIEFDYVLNDSKVIYVINSKDSEAYRIYNQHLRDEKINKILDGSN